MRKQVAIFYLAAKARAAKKICVLGAAALIRMRFVAHDQDARRTAERCRAAAIVEEVGLHGHRHGLVRRLHSVEYSDKREGGSCRGTAT